MAGLLINSTDLEASHGFRLSEVILGFAPSRRITETIPGVDGELLIAVELEPRPITLRGVVVGTSQSNMYTKVLAIDALLTGSLNAAPNVNFESPSRPEVSLTIPDFGGKALPYCSFAGGEIDYLGKRRLTWKCILTLRFIQSHPCTTTAT